MIPLRLLIVQIAWLGLPAFNAMTAEPLPPQGKAVPLFDGRTLAGWEGIPKLWRVEDGALTGGSLTETVKQNEFLATTRDYTNFIVRFKIKLTGTNGFINSGFQIRSQRVPNNSEMAGYQCDYGEPNWYGAIYDESRRNKVMAASDMKALRPALRVGDWNEYVIRADGPRVTTWINGVMGTDFHEPDLSIPNYDWGKLGIQVHGGGKAVVQVKDISIEELPSGKKFIGAPEPGKGAKASPLTPEEERASFTLAPGFEIELVAAESEGIGKFVAVDWDLHGRLWTMTALEYPVDANENPAAAKELYASKARDKVLVFDRDQKSPTGYSPKPRVFADGLAIPLGILPYKNGVYVQHGPDIVFLSDTDGDGRADKREVILTGFGVQDSHLFPHQFTRAPGNWIWMAQGAFNYGKVRTTTGKEQQFDQTRMAKFRYDGSDFEITSQGPCNIWGLVLDGEGQAWIQEANDYGYPVMPFHEYANYPGCSDAQWKSYAPEFPGTAPEFRMGGTGLSGLALSDKWAGGGSNQYSVISNQSATAKPKGLNTDSLITDYSTFPGAYCSVFYIANPIVRKIQAVLITPDGPRFRYQRLPDFIQSSDEWFRPVALRTGPDGCLYIVDWYNKIISHNEVPRNHPDRDKKRGRIWRVKHKDQTPFAVPDFMKLSGDELLAKLGGPSLPQSHMAWQAVVDRQMKELVVPLQWIVANEWNPLAPPIDIPDRQKESSSPRPIPPIPARTPESAGNSPAARLAALWCLEGLLPGASGGLDILLASTNRNFRREAVRALAESGSRPPTILNSIEPLADDPDPVVRAELIRAAGRLLDTNFPGAQVEKYWLKTKNPGVPAPLAAKMVEAFGRDLRAVERVVGLLARMAKASLAEPTVKSTHNGRTIKTDEAYEREFERYLVRFFLERNPEAVAPFLDSEAAKALPVENRLVAALSLEPKASAARVATLLPSLDRPPGQEELMRLAQFPDEPGVGETLKGILQKPATGTAALESLLKVRTRLDAAKLTPVLTDAAKHLLASAEAPKLELGARLASSFQIAALEPQLASVLEKGLSWNPREGPERKVVLKAESLAALRALRELKSDQVDVFAQLAEKGDAATQEAAIAALAGSRDPRGPQQLASLYPNLPAAPRHTALGALTGSKTGASALVKSVRSGAIPKDELDGAAFDKLQAALGDDADLAALVQEMASFFRPVLRLDGNDNAWSETDITLDGPFTVETWVKLDPGIDNNDGILGAPGVLDMNFFAGQFRVWVGAAGVHDAIVAKKKISADNWTHVAVTRDAEGQFRIYQNGELDTDEGTPVKSKFEHLRIGWTAAAKGTAGWLSEFRVWDRARTADELRADFDRNFQSELGNRKSQIANRESETPAGLVHLYTGTNWGKLHGGAKVQKTADFPPLLTEEESKALAEKFSRFHALADKVGDAARGQALFASLCQSCHNVGGQGGQVGPVLSGAGALGVEALLRNILTPNAAMEPGYRAFRVELKDGDVLDGILVSQDAEALVLRRPNVEDTRLAQKDVRKAGFTKKSMMPEGLLDPLPPAQVTDLFAYLKTLK